MGAKKELVGQRFGRLLVLDESKERKHGCVVWRCQCDCGAITLISSAKLICGDIKSCGCLKVDVARTIGKKTAFLGSDNPSYRHGQAKSRLYRIWCAMKKRCYDPKANNYRYYGGRGIVVCDEWKKDYVPFMEWAVSSGYKDNLSIDRIDPDGNYTPENCRWVTMSVQNSNKNEFRCPKRSIRVVCVETGSQYNSITDAAEFAGVSRRAISACIHGRSKSSGGYRWKIVEKDTD